MQHNCYILANIKYNHATYCGYTNNLEKRLKQHNGLLSGGAKCTAGKGGWVYLAVVSGFLTKSNAMSFEWKLKHPGGKKHKNSKYCGIYGRIMSLLEFIDNDDDKKKLILLCFETKNHNITIKNIMTTTGKLDITLNLEGLNEQNKLLSQMCGLMQQMVDLQTKHMSMCGGAVNCANNNADDNADDASDAGSEQNVAPAKNTVPSEESESESEPEPEPNPFDEKTVKKMKKLVAKKDREGLDVLRDELMKTKGMDKKQWKEQIKLLEKESA